MKYEFIEKSRAYILSTETTMFKVSKCIDSNQDEIYNQVIMHIETEIFTLKIEDIKQINLFLNTARHVGILDIKELLKLGGRVMASKSKRKNTKAKTGKKELLPVCDPVSNTEVETAEEHDTGEVNTHDIEKMRVETIAEQQEKSHDYKQVKKCYHCGNKSYRMYRKIWQTKMYFYSFDGKLKEEFIDENAYEILKRVYCSECGTCLGTLEKNLYLDVNTNQLFIKDM